MCQHKYRFFAPIIFSAILALVSSCIHAATPIDLRHQALTALKSFVADKTALIKCDSETDFNQTTHTRLQQTYAGYSVWGASPVMHESRYPLEKTTMNGLIYRDLAADLGEVPAYILSAAQQDKVLQQAVELYEKASGARSDIGEATAKVIIYVDANNQAHWAFIASFLTKSGQGTPIRPTYIFDAIKLNLYQQWNNIKSLEKALGGGFGGNQKTGKHSYDSLAGDFPKLEIQRDTQSKFCYLKNADVAVKDARNQFSIVKYSCPEKNPQHNNLFWDADLDGINGAYSPDNDALYIGKIVKDMYQKWYGIPVLTKNGKPMMLDMLVHAKMENAMWDGREMIFGDGGSYFYPLVSLGVGAHEISHGFTEQHSNLEYYGQSGALNESFSDMASKAAEFYALGSNDWRMGADIVKAKDKALRYMDEPTRDCPSGGRPGNDCSISHVKDYRAHLDVHYSSGVFNKAFYLLSTAPGWNTKKAFDVMVHANAHYWTATDNFAAAACGVIDAAKDYKYDVASVAKAMTAVGIKTVDC